MALRSRRKRSASSERQLTLEQFGEPGAPTLALPITGPGSDTQRADCLTRRNCASFPYRGCAIANAYLALVLSDDKFKAYRVRQWS